MRNLIYKFRLMLVGIFVAVGAGAIAQVGSGVGTSAPPLSDTPTFRSLTVNDDVNATLTALVDNDNNGTGNAARVSISSGASNGALFVAGSGRTSTIVTGGPTGAQSVLRNLGSYPLVFGTNNTSRMQIAGDGDITMNGVDATHESGSYSADTGGCVTEITGTIFYERQGNLVYVEYTPNSATCTSNDTAFTISGTNSPTSIRPSTTTQPAPVGPMQNSGVTEFDTCVQVNASGVFQFKRSNCLSTTSWTASGSKGWITSGRAGGFGYTYRID